VSGWGGPVGICAFHHKALDTYPLSALQTIGIALLVNPKPKTWRSP